MFEKIVLATDLSPAWDEIIACAGELKALGQGTLILVAGTFTGIIESYLQSKSARVGTMLQQAAGGLIFFAGCYLFFQEVRSW